MHLTILVTFLFLDEVVMGDKEKERFKKDLELLRRAAWPRQGVGIRSAQNFLIKWEQFLLNLTKNKKFRGISE